jgi:glycosyltransferase involved in cell wall biosynthesis
MRATIDVTVGSTDGERPRVSAIVPARNEAARIAATIDELARHVDEVVVVDDASDDETGAVASGAGAVVLRNDRRLGYIGSIKRGFGAATGSIVVTVDADGEMPVERIAELVAPIVDGTADMVQGHRSRVARISERLVTAIAALGGGGDSGTGFRPCNRPRPRAEIPGSCICGPSRSGMHAMRACRDRDRRPSCARPSTMDA